MGHFQKDMLGRWFENRNKGEISALQSTPGLFSCFDFEVVFAIIVAPNLS